MRSKKALYNTAASIGYEVIAVICGLILPRLILSHFGSSYNGITTSITQFLSCVALLKGGIGAVTRASLYKPLAEKNTYELSAIVNATAQFMKKIALIFLGAIFIFAAVYPLLVKGEFEWLFSFTLVLILGISTFIQYYFGLAYQFLFEADQRQYVLMLAQTFSTILNTLLAAILIYAGAGIHIVKLGSALAFSINPIFIFIYAKRKYKIDKTVKPDNSAIAQRWDAFAQSVAYFIHNNTDVILLTFFTNTKEVSVYTVYNYVIFNIRNVISTFVTGFGAAFGNMLAKGEQKLIETNLKIYELIIFGTTSIIYTTAGIMIVPFALLYTSGVNDVNYSRPVFALLITIAGAFSCFRIPYQTIVEAAGHFKQTKNGAIFEAVLNITISLIFVTKLGLIGVAIGTLAATVFRSFQYAMYLSKHIVKRNIMIFVSHILVNAAVAVITFVIATYLFTFDTPNFAWWVLKAFLVVITSAIISFIIHFVFYRKDIIALKNKAVLLIKKKFKG
ncbi:MAG: polysaccharide biosynthesis C-terminal domain-containing protein [Clostridium sp.]|nr:polysaccharide biosynthesis C-terminal domain-containing protein [Clostridium sp.]